MDDASEFLISIVVEAIDRAGPTLAKVASEIQALKALAGEETIRSHPTVGLQQGLQGTSQAASETTSTLREHRDEVSRTSQTIDSHTQRVRTARTSLDEYTRSTDSAGDKAAKLADQADRLDGIFHGLNDSFAAQTRLTKEQEAEAQRLAQEYNKLARAYQIGSDEARKYGLQAKAVQDILSTNTQRVRALTEEQDRYVQGLNRAVQADQRATNDRVAAWNKEREAQQALSDRIDSTRTRYENFVGSMRRGNLDVNQSAIGYRQMSRDLDGLARSFDSASPAAIHFANAARMAREEASRLTTTMDSGGGAGGGGLGALLLGGAAGRGGGWGPARWAAMGSLGAFGGLGLEHLLMTGVGLAGSAAGAVGGGGLLAGSSLATTAVGAGSDMAVMSSTIKDTQALYKQLQTNEQSVALAQAQVNAAVSQYGKNSQQAASAQQNLFQAQTRANQALQFQMQELGPAAQSQLALAKQIDNLNHHWDQATAKARIAADTILGQLVGIAYGYIDLIAQAATKNFGIIDQHLQPLFKYLEGPGKQIFNDLENIFAARLPKAVDAFVQGFELVSKVIDYIAKQFLHGGFITAVDNFFTKWNDPSNWGKLTQSVDHLIGLFESWKNFLEILVKDIYQLFHADANTGQTIIDTLTQMLDKLHQWETSTRGQQELHNIFVVHRDEAIALLKAFVPLIEAFGRFYMVIAPPLTKAVTLVVEAFGGLLNGIINLGNEVGGPFKTLWNDGILIPFGAFLLMWKAWNFDTAVSRFRTLGTILLSPITKFNELRGAVAAAFAAMAAGEGIVGRLKAGLDAFKTSMGVGGATAAETPAAAMKTAFTEGGAAAADEIGTAITAAGARAAEEIALGVAGGAGLGGVPGGLGGRAASTAERATATEVAAAESAAARGTSEIPAIVPTGSLSAGIGGRLLAGAGVFGLGALGSSLAGHAIGGKAGGAVSTIGTFASGGAAIGTLFPELGGPITGALAGAVVGGLVQGFKSFIHTDAGKYGKDIASAVTAPMGQEVGRQFNSQIVQHLNAAQQAQKFTQIPLNPGERLPPGAAQQAQKEFDAAGQAAGDAFIKGFNQVQIKTEPQFILNARMTLNSLPPQARDAAAATMVQYAQSLEKSGQLPKGATDQVIHDLEKSYSGLGDYLQRQSIASSREIASKMTFQGAINNLIKTEQDIKSKFGLWATNGNLNGHNYTRAFQTEMSQLENIAAHTTGKAKDAALQAIGQLRTQSDATLKGMLGDFDSRLSQISGNLAQGPSGHYWSQAVQQALNNFSQFAQGVGSLMASGATSSTKGAEAIYKAMVAIMKSVQGKPPGPLQLDTAKVESTVIAGAAQIGQGVLGLGAGIGRARGGYEKPETGGKIIQVAEGGYPEVVLTTDPKHAGRQRVLLSKYLQDAPHVARSMHIPGYASGGVVTASEFGGPNDPGTGSSGYRGDNLFMHPDSYAELGMGHALGGLPYLTPLDVSYHGHTARLLKRDIGAGGPGMSGHPRAIDLWYQAATALGFSGLDLVTINGPSGVNLSVSGSPLAAPQTINVPKLSGPPGTVHEATQRALQKMTDAANAYVAAHMPVNTAVGVSTGMPVRHGKFIFPLPPGSWTPGAVDQGWDVAAPGHTPLFAIGSGTIINHGISGFGPWAPVLGLDSGGAVYYGHAGPGGAVPTGTHVQAGQVIGEVGAGIVGISTGPHLEIGWYPPGSMGSGASMKSALGYMKGGWIPAVAAAQGFHGVVDSPTMFLAGEAGRAEAVNITPAQAGGYFGPLDINAPAASNLTGVSPFGPDINEPSGLARAEQLIGAIAQFSKSGIQQSLNPQDIGRTIHALSSGITGIGQVGDNLTKFMDLLGSITTQGGPLDQLDQAIQQLFTQMSNKVLQSAIHLDRHGIAIETQTPEQQDIGTANAYRRELGALGGEQHIITQAQTGVRRQLARQLRVHPSRLRGMTPFQLQSLISKRAPKSAAAHRLLLQYTNLYGRANTVQGEQAQTLSSLYQEEGTRLSDEVTGIQNDLGNPAQELQTAASQAQAFGTFGATSIGQALTNELIANAQAQVRRYTDVLHRAQQEGNQAVVTQARQQIDQLNNSIVSYTTQLLESQASYFQQQAQYQTSALQRSTSFAQNVVGKGIQGAGGVAQTIAAILQLGVLQQTGSVLQGQLTGLQGFYQQAEAQGNIQLANQLLDQIGQLNEQLAENTQALSDQTTAVRQTTIDYINRTTQLQTGVFGSLYSALQTLGQIQGGLNVPAAIGVTQGSIGALTGAQGGLAAQLFGLTNGGVNLQGLSGTALIQALASLPFTTLEAGMTATQVTQFEALVSQMAQNEAAIEQNTQQLQTLNGQMMQPQSFSSTTWQMFRSALFTGMGGLLPRYQSPAGVAGQPFLSGPSSISSVNKQEINVNLTNPTQTTDPNYLGAAIAWHAASAP